MSKWKDIDTAPYDGTRILLYRREWGENIAVGFWHTAEQQWELYGGTPWFGPTHWMPLPKEPE
jgi:hypothetical protein